MKTTIIMESIIDVKTGAPLLTTAPLNVLHISMFTIHYTGTSITENKMELIIFMMVVTLIKKTHLILIKFLLVVILIYMIEHVAIWVRVNVFILELNHLKLNKNQLQIKMNGTINFKTALMKLIVNVVVEQQSNITVNVVYLTITI